MLNTVTAREVSAQATRTPPEVVPTMAACVMRCWTGRIIDELRRGVPFSTTYCAKTPEMPMNATMSCIVYCSPGPRWGTRAISAVQSGMGADELGGLRLGLGRCSHPGQLSQATAATGPTDSASDSGLETIHSLTDALCCVDVERTVTMASSSTTSSRGRVPRGDQASQRMAARRPVATMATSPGSPGWTTHTLRSLFACALPLATSPAPDPSSVASQAYATTPVSDQATTRPSAPRPGQALAAAAVPHAPSTSSSATTSSRRCAGAFSSSALSFRTVTSACMLRRGSWGGEGEGGRGGDHCGCDHDRS